MRNEMILSLFLGRDPFISCVWLQGTGQFFRFWFEDIKILKAVHLACRTCSSSSYLPSMAKPANAQARYSAGLPARASPHVRRATTGARPFALPP